MSQVTSTRVVRVEVRMLINIAQAMIGKDSMGFSGVGWRLEVCGCCLVCNLALWVCSGA